MKYLLWLLAILVVGCITFHYYINKQQNPTTDRMKDSRLWALAASAVLTEANGQQHNMLGGGNKNDDNTKQWKKILRDYWGVENKKDLLDTLEWIEREGHRKSFEEVGEQISRISELQRSLLLAKVANNEQAKSVIMIVTKYYPKLGKKKSLKGWDYSRYISLCRWGYLVGYFSEKEAWKKIMPVARKLQKTFDSWEELGQNYIIGREYWSYKATQRSGQKYRRAYKKLLDDDQSPWNTLDWDTNLKK